MSIWSSEKGPQEVRGIHDTGNVIDAYAGTGSTDATIDVATATGHHSLIRLSFFSDSCGPGHGVDDDIMIDVEAARNLRSLLDQAIARVEKDGS